MSIRNPVLVLCFCLASCFAQEKGRAIKDSYYLPYVGAPEYVIGVSAMTNRNYREEFARLRETVKRFAVDHRMQACSPTNILFYSGPPFSDFKDEHVGVVVGDTVRLAPYDEGYPLEDVRKLAEALADRLREAFPGRVSVQVRKYLSK
jgi:hypothetical protein